MSNSLVPRFSYRSTRPVRARAFLVLALGSTLIHAAPLLADSPLPRSTPEAQGVSSGAIADFLETADAIDTMNSFMLVRRGHVIAEGWWAPYTAADPHMAYSLTKSFTSTAIGLSIAEGRLSINDPVISFFPAETPANPSENLKNLRVRDLLIMSTGHHAEAIAGFSLHHDTSFAQRFLALPVAHKPGTFFLYNSPGTNMQAAIVEKLTGESLGDYLRPRLFAPLGIADPAWERNAHGDTDGAGGLRLRTEDIARFGQLYLQRGQWQGRQLLPAAWVDAATAKQTSNGSSPNSDWDQGYGYQFWRCRPGFYRGDGAHGQYCIVMPEQQAVVAITSGVRNMQAVMNVVWDRLLPALGDAKIEASAADQARLKQKLASLAVRGPQNVAATSSQAAQFAGRTYTFPANERKLTSLQLQVSSGRAAFVVRMDGGEPQTIAIGSGTWQRGGTTRFGSDVDPRRRGILRDEPVSAIGGWETPDTFVAQLCYHETPYIATVRLRFGGDLVVLNAAYNVAFGSDFNAFPELVGRAGP